MSQPNRKHASQQSVNSAVKGICNIMRRSDCAGALQYVPELTWILFLRILDEREEHEAEEAAALGLAFTPTMQAPFRWQDWADPHSPRRRGEGEYRGFSAWDFVHDELLPHLHGLKKQLGATPRQKVVSEIMARVKESAIDTEKNFLDVLDAVHEISTASVDDTHVFTLSQVYEGLLLKMGEKGNDGGQFFTPREVIRAMVRVIDPQVGETVYDPGCGTGGFLAQSYEHMRGKAKSAVDLATLKQRTFYGREKDTHIYPIALLNLVLHGIDEPRIWHGNTLSKTAVSETLFQGAPAFFDVVLMNPPFGGKEGKEAQTPYEYKTNATQVLFLQNVLQSMKTDSRCGIVLDEGVLFRVDSEAVVKTKRKLLEECDVYCIVSLAGGVFTAAGAGVKTNLVFFKKGRSTERIWYYDLSDVKVGKKTPMTLAHFEEFIRLLPERADSERSWTIDFAARLQKALDDAAPHRAQAEYAQTDAKALEDEWRAAKKQHGASAEPVLAALEKWNAKLREAREQLGKAEAIENAAIDLKAVNPNRITEVDARTPADLLSEIETRGREADTALEHLRSLLNGGTPLIDGASAARSTQR